jgi:hypothetical protein
MWMPSAFYFRCVWLLALGSALRCYAGSPGQLDLSFTPGSGINGSIHSVAAEPDGSVLIGGAFTTVRGAYRSHIARLQADGSADVTFDAGTGPDGEVLAVLMAP